MKKAILIGLGGMGLRYIKVLKSLNFIIIGVCDKNIKKLNNINISSAIKTTNINDLLKIKADIVCISSNTFSREKIIEKFLNQSQVKRLLIEKPLATSYKKCLTLVTNLKNYLNIEYVNNFSQGIYKDKKIAITGSFENFKRSEIEVKLRSLGGKVLSSISKNTDFLIAGKDAGSKLQKAGSMNIDIKGIDFVNDLMNN